MKVIIYLKKHLSKLLLYSLCQFTFSTPTLAQHQQEHGNPPANKHIFLLMMDTMMKDMDHAKNSDAAETDFLSQMLPHHEGAMKMAAYEIEKGKNFQMRQLAKSILAEQSTERQQMQLWLRKGLTNTTEADEKYRNLMDSAMAAMMRSMPSSITHLTTDKAFAVVMVPHHQAAIDMAKYILQFTNNASVKAFATQLISAEEVEIEQMVAFLKK